MGLWSAIFGSSNRSTPAQQALAAAVAPGDLEFLSVDVETACRDASSICQVGIVGFADGRVAFEFATLVDPQQGFDDFNVRLHGIDARRVRGQWCYGEAHSVIDRHLTGREVVSHTDFDRRALTAAAALHGRGPIRAAWHDSVNVARRAWPGLENHKLRTLADHLGIEITHHDALSDARAAGLVVVHALRETGMSLGALSQGGSPARRAERSSLKRASTVDGPLAGEHIVMTGDMSSPKAELADRIAKAGGCVNAAPTRKTTILVLGLQDPSTFAGKAKSSKHLRAEELAAGGQPIRILSEAEFLALWA